MPVAGHPSFCPCICYRFRSEVPKGRGQNVGENVMSSGPLEFADETTADFPDRRTSEDSRVPALKLAVHSMR